MSYFIQMFLRALRETVLSFSLSLDRMKILSSAPVTEPPPPPRASSPLAFSRPRIQSLESLKCSRSFAWKLVWSTDYREPSGNRVAFDALCLRWQRRGSTPLAQSCRIEWNRSVTSTNRNNTASTSIRQSLLLTNIVYRLSTVHAIPRYTQFIHTRSLSLSLSLSLCFLFLFLFLRGKIQISFYRKVCLRNRVGKFIIKCTWIYLIPDVTGENT